MNEWIQGPRAALSGRHAILEIERGIGLMAWATSFGPAARRSSLDDLLHRAGVLALDPLGHVDSPVLAALPWDAKRFPAPPPPSPPGLEAPWPQPSPLNPAFPAPVLDLDPAERRAHLRYNVLRYLGQAITRRPLSALRACRGPRLVPVDDEALADLVCRTSFAQFVHPTLDPPDRAAFGPLLSGDLRTYAKIDASAVDPRHRLPGIHVAPTVTLLRREAEDRYRPVAIRCGDRVLRPDDGDAWALARYFVIQGLQTLLVIVFHPRLHFPNDAINALSRALLPPDHVISKLIRPHLSLCLGLHEAAIHHRRSVLHNSQREIYTPFPFTTEGTHAGMATGMRGIEGNSAYPAYRFGPALPGDHTPYGRYRRDWYQAFARFFDRALRGVAPDDPYVVRWADQACRWVPGFPDGRGMRIGSMLVGTGSGSEHTCSGHVRTDSGNERIGSMLVRTGTMHVRSPLPGGRRTPPRIVQGAPRRRGCPRAGGSYGVNDGRNARGSPIWSPRTASSCGSGSRGGAWDLRRKTSSNRPSSGSSSGSWRRASRPTSPRR
jgi:hypothetical protein